MEKFLGSVVSVAHRNTNDQNVWNNSST